MTDKPGDRPVRFTRVDPEPAETDSFLVRARFEQSLNDIDAFLHQAVAGGRSAFTSASPAYASGSMAVIRAAALFETDDFVTFLEDVPPDVVQGIKMTRNIASHSGYRSMNDDLFWTTLTVHLPPYLAKWREAAKPK